MTRPTPAALALGLWAVLAGCRDDATLTGVAPAAAASEVRNAVVGEAALALDSDGRFRLSPPPGLAERGEIGRDRAREIARGWALVFAPLVLRRLEEQHGGRIAPEELWSCGRVLYSHSVLEPMDEAIPLPRRRAFGSWWLVTMCGQRGQPQVSLAVSTRTEVELVAEGLRFPPIHGNDVVWRGIPRGHVGEYPSAPEDAVVLAHRLSGQRIAAPPILVATIPSTGIPQMARWKLTLEDPARARTATGRAVTTTHAFVGHATPRRPSLELQVPSAEQPDSVEVFWWTIPEIGERRSDYEARRQDYRAQVPRLPQFPLMFEPVAAWERRNALGTIVTPDD